MTNTEMEHAIFWHYGYEHQLMKTVEELTELATELCRVQDKRTKLSTIAMEMADVEILLEQLKLYYGTAWIELMKEAKQVKLRRQIERMKEES